MHHSETQIFKKSDLCRSPKILGQPLGPQERCCGGAAKSLDTALQGNVPKTEHFLNVQTVDIEHHLASNAMMFVCLCGCIVIM